MGLDVQIFTEGEQATWYKPDGAMRVDVIIRGGDGGGKDGGEGELKANAFPAAQLDDEVHVTVARGGRGSDGEPAGFGGYAVIITHLTDLSEAIGVSSDGEPVGITLMAQHRGEFTCQECDESAAGEWDGDPGHSNLANTALNVGAEHARTSGHKVTLESRAHAR